MNDRKNLQKAIELDREMRKIEIDKRHLDEIKNLGIDKISVYYGAREHSLDINEILELKLEDLVELIIKDVQERRDLLFKEKEKEFKEL